MQGPTEDLAPRRLAIGKRLSLAGIADDWDDRCYIVLRPMTYDDRAAASEIADGLTNAEAQQIIKKAIKDHTLSGKVLVYGTDGSPVLADILAEDLDLFDVNTMDLLYAKITGQEYEDPKAIGRKTANETHPPSEPQEPEQAEPDPSTATS